MLLLFSSPGFWGFAPARARLRLGLAHALRVMRGGDGTG